LLHEESRQLGGWCGAGRSRERITAIIGDDVLDLLQGTDLSVLERSGTLSSLDGIISANAYLGMDGILDALAADADVIVAGRVADPLLFLAPLVHRVPPSSRGQRRHRDGGTPAARRSRAGGRAGPAMVATRTGGRRQASLYLVLASSTLTSTPGPVRDPSVGGSGFPPHAS